MDSGSLATGKRPKVLFLCFGNSCRSIMAEALARYFLPGDMEACSAGLLPLGSITPQTIEVLEEAGIPTDGLYSKGLGDVRLDDMDYIINLTDLKVSWLLPKTFRGKQVSCYVLDPFDRGIDAFRAVRNELAQLVKEKLPRLMAGDL